VCDSAGPLVNHFARWLAALGRSRKTNSQCREHDLGGLVSSLQAYRGCHGGLAESPISESAGIKKKGHEEMRARFITTCPICGKKIKIGQPIIYGFGRTRHTYCKKTNHKARAKMKMADSRSRPREIDARTAAGLAAAERAGFR
jgi:hypothetical protein